MKLPPAVVPVRPEEFGPPRNPAATTGFVFGIVASALAAMSVAAALIAAISLLHVRQTLPAGSTVAVSFFWVLGPWILSVPTALVAMILGIVGWRRPWSQRGLAKANLFLCGPLWLACSLVMWTLPLLLR